jgi:uncharacterized protein
MLLYVVGIAFFLLFLASIFAQLYVDYVFHRWSQVSNRKNLTGEQLVERLSTSEQLGTQLTFTPKRLADHYDPRTNTVCLSLDVASNPSVAALAISAHELGHAQQQKDSSGLMRLRELLVPAVRISPLFIYGLVATGLALRFTSLFWLAGAAFAVTGLFMLLTLPVEFDASRRALVMLERNELLLPEDRKGARQMLTAAGLTYVVASVFSVAQFLRFVLLARR